MTPYFPSNSTLANATGKIFRVTRTEGNGSETITKEEAFLLAVKSVNPELSEQENECIQACWANCSLKNFSQLMDIKRYQELYEHPHQHPDCCSQKEIRP